ncbi:Protein of unknown function (DUF1279), putative [Trypanosoma equiperdum]|uniref:WW domain-containing protein n=1 Tax=Trypanosoma equiperdum TaxID=5694 RepID=A0A1G4I7E1_TRYEQ|nr:Protein of unknown function (DUF1279), putative [Trypanosoma equiperdum]
MRRIACVRLNVGLCRYLAHDAASGVAPPSNGVKDQHAVGRGVVLPAVRAAMCVARPCPMFAATITSNEIPHYDDPCVVWREYFSLQYRKPYYHHLVTNVTTFEVPEGFTTRFPTYHRRQKLFVDEANRVFRNSGSPGVKTNGIVGNTDGFGSSSSSCSGFPPDVNPPPPSGPSPHGVSGLKHKLAAYGAGGLLLYLIVHNILLAIIFFTLYFLHIDVVAYARSYGFKVGKEDGTSEAPSTDVDSGNGKGEKKYPSFWTALALSILLNKLLVPLEVAVTVVLAPRLVPRLQPIAARVIPRVKSIIAGCKAGK